MQRVAHAERPSRSVVCYSSIHHSASRREPQDASGKPRMRLRTSRLPNSNHIYPNQADSSIGVCAFVGESRRCDRTRLSRPGREREAPVGVASSTTPKRPCRSRSRRRCRELRPARSGTRCRRPRRWRHRASERACAGRPREEEDAARSRSSPIGSVRKPVEPSVTTPKHPDARMTARTARPGQAARQLDAACLAAIIRGDGHIFHGQLDFCLLRTILDPRSLRGQSLCQMVFRLLTAFPRCCRTSDQESVRNDRFKPAPAARDGDRRAPR